MAIKVAKYELIPATSYQDCLAYLRQLYHEMTGAPLTGEQLDFWGTMRSPLAITVGRRIAAERRRAGLTLADMAERLGWSQDTYNHYEYGRRAPQLDRLAAIADVLAVPLAALLTDDEQLAAIVAQLARHPDLVGEVAFFLKSLEQELPAPDAPTSLDSSPTSW